MAALCKRKLLTRMVTRDVAIRYRGAFFGALWLVGQPLVLMLTYTFVFAVLFPSGDGIQVSALAIFLGISFYQVFAETLTRAASLLPENPAYVKKVAFPLRMFVWVPVLTSLVARAVSLAIFVVAYPFMIGTPPITWIAFPLAILPLMVFTLGCSYFFAGLSAAVSDVKHAAPLITTPLMFASPVVYSADIIPDHFRDWAILSPLFTTFEALRSTMIDGQWPDLYALSVSTMVSLVVLLVGYAIFCKMQKGFADVI